MLSTLISSVDLYGRGHVGAFFSFMAFWLELFCASAAFGFFSGALSAEKPKVVINSKATVMMNVLILRTLQCGSLCHWLAHGCNGDS